MDHSKSSYEMPINHADFRGFTSLAVPAVDTGNLNGDVELSAEMLCNHTSPSYRGAHSTNCWGWDDLGPTFLFST